MCLIFLFIFLSIIPSRYIFLDCPMCSKCPHYAGERAIHHSSTTQSWESSWANRLSTVPYTGEFVTESPVWGRVREQFAHLEQSSVRNDIFLGVVSYVSSECLKSTHRFVDIKPHIHMLRVYGHRRWRQSSCQVSAHTVPLRYGPLKMCNGHDKIWAIQLVGRSKLSCVLCSIRNSSEWQMRFTVACEPQHKCLQNLEICLAHRLQWRF